MEPVRWAVVCDHRLSSRLQTFPWPFLIGKIDNCKNHYKGGSRTVRKFDFKEVQKYDSSNRKSRC